MIRSTLKRRTPVRAHFRVFQSERVPEESRLIVSLGMWGGASQSDNGTASWGQASDGATGWGEQDEPSKVSGWGGPPSNAGKHGEADE